MKFLIPLLLGVIFSSCAFANVDFSVSYSPAADEFHLMDEVSNWWPGYCELEYQKYWDKTFGLSSEDRSFFSEYQKLQQKYFADPDQAEKDPLRNRNGFFATTGARTANRIGKLFYSSETLDQAFKKAGDFLTVEEIAFLKKFYSHFQKKIDVLLSESVAFKPLTALISKKIESKEVGSYFQRVSRFYNVESNAHYSILYLWWPPLSRTQQSPDGDTILAMYHPKTQMSLAQKDIDILFHEVVHTISSKQSLAQKSQLTHEFLAICALGPNLKKLTLLEEPLAVAIGQLLFKRDVLHEDMAYASNLYNNPWIQTMGRLIYPLVDQDFKTEKRIDQGFIKNSASICRDLKNAIEMMAPKTNVN